MISYSLGLLKKISLIGNAISMILLGIVTSLITIDVFGRFVIGKSTLIANEVSAFMLIAMVYMGLAYVQRKRKHLQVRILTSHLPQKINRLIRVIVLIITIIFVSYLAVLQMNFVIRNYSLGVRSLGIARIPLWIPYAFVPLGIIMYSLEVLVELIETIRKIYEQRRSFKH